MNKERQILDQYFDKARSEAPVMSKAEARKIVERGVVAGTVAGTFIGGTSALWSSPLRMAAAASLAVVAGTGIWYAATDNGHSQLAGAGIPASQSIQTLDAEPLEQELEKLAVVALVDETEVAEEQTHSQVDSPAAGTSKDDFATATDQNLSTQFTQATSAVAASFAAQDVHQGIGATPASFSEPEEPVVPALNRPSATELTPASALAPTEITMATSLPSGHDFGSPVASPDAPVSETFDLFAEKIIPREWDVFAGVELGAFWQQLDYLNLPLEAIGLEQLPPSSQHIGFFVGVSVDDYVFTFTATDSESMSVEAKSFDEFSSLTYDYGQVSLSALYNVLDYENFTMQAGVGFTVSDEHILVNDVRIAAALAPRESDISAAIAARAMLNGGDAIINIERRLLGVGPRVALAYEFFGAVRTGLKVAYIVQHPESFNVNVTGDGFTAVIPDSEQYTNNVWAVSADMQVDLGSLF